MSLDLGLTLIPIEISFIEFIILCLISFLSSALSASLGLGGGIMTITAFIYLLNPLAVIPVHAITQANSNFFRALMMRKYINYKWIGPFTIGTIFGVTIGGQLAFNMPKHLLEGIIGIFVIYSLWGPKSINFTKPTNIVSLFTGLITSFATMFVGGTGPLVAPFIRSTTNDRKIIVATQGAYMSIQHGLKILVFGILGFTFGPYIVFILSMAIFGILGSLFGKYLLDLMPERLFIIGFNSIITGLAIKLIYSPIKVWFF
tara:strand:- start:2222 stop:2998 length:777 start_codon:yes stop_codon:yes gene_type:complete